MKKFRTILLLISAAALMVGLLLNRMISKKEISDKMKAVRAGKEKKKVTESLEPDLIEKDQIEESNGPEKSEELAVEG